MVHYGYPAVSQRDVHFHAVWCMPTSRRFGLMGAPAVNDVLVRLNVESPALKNLFAVSIRDDQHHLPQATLLQPFCCMQCMHVGHRCGSKWRRTQVWQGPMHMHTCVHAHKGARSAPSMQSTPVSAKMSEQPALLAGWLPDRPCAACMRPTLGLAQHARQPPAGIHRAGIGCCKGTTADDMAP
eukprot:363471-Chlamydomonas_euryale.AAC.6